jgi:hypothetical protein
VIYSCPILCGISGAEIKRLRQRAADARYREKNEEKVRAKCRAYARKHRATLAVAYKAWCRANPERVKVARKLWGQRNKAHCAEYKRERQRRDPQFKLAGLMRTRIYGALRGIEKSARTEELLGCAVPLLRAHLEVQFRPGMSWDNYGLWHVDHIKPCAKFDLRHASEQRKCFHYSNLQPLWAEENRRKGAR